MTRMRSAARSTARSWTPPRWTAPAPRTPPRVPPPPPAVEGSRRRRRHSRRRRAAVVRREDEDGNPPGLRRASPAVGAAGEARRRRDGGAHALPTRRRRGPHRRRHVAPVGPVRAPRVRRRRRAREVRRGSGQVRPQRSSRGVSVPSVGDDGGGGGRRRRGDGPVRERDGGAPARGDAVARARFVRGFEGRRGVGGRSFETGAAKRPITRRCSRRWRGWSLGRGTRPGRRRWRGRGVWCRRRWGAAAGREVAF